MTSRYEYKEALGRLDKDTRICLKYLEKLINDKFNAAIAAYQPPAPSFGLSKIESQLDSLQKQIDGLRPKIDVGYTLAQEHDGREKYLKKLTKNVENILEEMKKYFDERYKSGYYSEGIRRKIREEGLLEKLERGT